MSTLAQFFGIVSFWGALGVALVVMAVAQFQQHLLKLRSNFTAEIQDKRGMTPA